MLTQEIRTDLAEVLSDPALRIEPRGLSLSEQDRWKNWALSGGEKYAPSPGQIDAAAGLIREAGLRAEALKGGRNEPEFSDWVLMGRVRSW